MEPLRQRNFALLWVGGLISMTGDGVLNVGLPLYIYRQTGSTLAIGVMVVVAVVPGLLFGSLAGVFVDRWDRRRTMIITNLLQAVVLLPLLLVQSAQQVWIIYGCLFVGATVSQFFIPAEQALLPLLVDEKDLASANSLSAVNSNLARLLGPALGGLIVGLTGLAGVALSDALSFALAAALIVFVTYRQKSPPAAPAAAGSILSSWRAVADEWREGLAVIIRTSYLARLVMISVLVMVGEGFFGTLIAPFVLNVIHGSEIDFGNLLASQAIGGIIGGIVIARIAKGISPQRLLGSCAIIFGLLDLALLYYPFWFSGIGLGLVLIALVGLPAVGARAGMMTLLQSLTEDAYRGRVFGLF